MDQHRYQAILGKITFRSAAHVGSGRATDATDAWLRRDAAGHIVIPGTAIAGALRTCATRLAPQLGMSPCTALMQKKDWKKFTSGGSAGQYKPCECPVCQLFGDLFPGNGDQNPDRSAYDARTTASRVIISDAYPPDGPSLNAETTVRDSVGIDRVQGAAARAGAVKFDLETLPPDAIFELRIELAPQVDETGETLLAAALAEWVEGRGALGGRTSRGFGALALSDVSKISITDDASGLMSFLRAEDPWRIASADTNWLDEALNRAHARINQQPKSPKPVSGEDDPIARSFVEVTFTLKGDGPMLTNDATTASLTGFDHAPALASWPKVLPERWQPSLIFPGASLRGVLRTRAEKIARTLVSLRIASQPDDHKSAFIKQCPACNPVESRPLAPLASCDALLQGSIEDDAEVQSSRLCLACRLFGSTQRGSRLKIEDARWAGALPPKWFKVQDFLAIDRFTGGGLDGAKFDALAVMNARFAVKMRLENPEPWELGWLMLVLRDLRDGLMRVGMGASKGYGKVVTEEITVKLGAIHSEDRKRLCAHLMWDDVANSGLYQSLLCNETELLQNPTWATQLQSWVREFHRELAKADRDLGAYKDEMSKLKDSYFGTPAEALYPVLPTAR